MDKNEFIFRTLIKNNHRLDEKYVRGLLYGIYYMCCGHSGYDYTRVNEGSVMIFRCTQEQYVEFTKVIENVYPGLCVFNYTYEHESA